MALSGHGCISQYKHRKPTFIFLALILSKILIRSLILFLFFSFNRFASFIFRSISDFCLSSSSEYVPLTSSPLSGIHKPLHLRTQPFADSDRLCQYESDISRIRNILVCGSLSFMLAIDDWNGHFNKVGILKLYNQKAIFSCENPTFGKVTSYEKIFPSLPQDTRNLPSTDVARLMTSPD